MSPQEPVSRWDHSYVDRPWRVRHSPNRTLRTSVVLLGLLFIFGLITIRQAYAQGFDPSVRVDDDLNPAHQEPAVAWGSDGALLAVYCERAVHWNPEFIMFTRSTDQGQTWLWPAIRVNDTVANAVVFPSFAVLQDGSLAVAWQESEFVTYNDQIRFSRSTDGGATWTPSVVVHPVDITVYFSRPSLVSAGSRILVSYWEQARGGRIMVVASDDFGVTWSAPVLVSDVVAPMDESAPVLAWNEARGEVGTVFATYDTRILFCASGDGGAHWSDPVQVNTVVPHYLAYPDLEAAQGVYHVVWMDDRVQEYDQDIYHSCSADGQSFTPSVRVNDSFPGTQYEPHLKVDSDGRIHVCWLCDWNLYYSISVDGGCNWLTPCPRVNDVSDVVQPFVPITSDILADSGGNPYVFWNDGRATGSYDNIYCTRWRSSSEVGAGVNGEGEFSLELLGNPGANPVVSFRVGSGSSRADLRLFDPVGRQVALRTLGSLSSREQRLALSDALDGQRLPNGVYLLRVSSAQGEAARRVVIAQ